MTPYSFLIYINDIINDIGSNIRLFAADTSPYVIVTDAETSAEILTLDLTKIEDWAEKWLLTFQPPKTESLVITGKQKRLLQPSNSICNETKP